MDDEKSLAQIAYEAFDAKWSARAEMGGFPWTLLPDWYQVTWEAAAAAVREAVLKREGKADA